MGLTSREMSPADKRVGMMARTAAGVQLTERFDRTFGFAHEALARLSPDEQAQLTSLLRKALPSQ